MYIQNGIVYAGEPKPLIKIVSIKPMNDYKLWVRFNSGETKVFDFQPLLDEPAFKPLKDKKIFEDVYLEYGCPVWQNGEIDIAPEFLFANSAMT